ncbi:lipoprotein, NLP/P60 family [hydrothermal vent metagenome]|uniref:Lipoprotein, NLP/P60 family n=1 Tax=hydrothermal vent metagenome TaxID=652676 RepID=A0A1W1CMY8_9ZZZZ
MKKFIISISLLSTLSSFLLAETILTLGERTPSAIDMMPANQIKDTLEIPQDTTEFAKKIIEMSDEEQLEYDRRYNEKFFEPWDSGMVMLSQGEKTWQFKYAKEKTYHEDGTLIPKSWYKKQIKNSNFSNSDSISQPAITLRHTNLKLYPSSDAIYYNPKRTGEGFPFDYNQNSSVHINTPLAISHYSLDKQWVYAQSSFASGWIKVDDIAFVTPEFQTKFKNGKYAITVKDNLSLRDDNGYISLVKIGSIFPVDPETKKYLIAKKDENGYAYLSKVTVNDIDIIAYKPIKFNSYNIAYISKQLVGEPYGWGGGYETRDCSALTKDFFAPFGIYLARNSRQQANSGNDFISIKGLDAATKQQMILDNAKPFRSLLFVPGHITLYLGEKKGEPIILHNYWGVRLKDGTKKVLARAIISTTKPGMELANVKKRSMLINTLTGIVNF